MWGLGLGCIMLLAVSVFASFCDASSAPSGLAVNDFIGGNIASTGGSPAANGKE